VKGRVSEGEATELVLLNPTNIQMLPSGKR
jgi:hypothetical protein